MVVERRAGMGSGGYSTLAKLGFVLFVWLSLAGCGGGGCPKPSASPESQEHWEKALDARKLLALNPKAELTIKRDVHNLVVSAEAGRFAAAFHDVMRDPKRRFGLIQVNRKRAALGEPFVMGERFQGRYLLEDAIGEKLDPRWRKLFGELLDDAGVQKVLCRVENQLTSDYGVISELELAPEPGHEYRLAYRYLEGSPIAGSSTFVVTPLDDARCRLTQIFEYQELSRDFALFFSSGGLKLHNQVVYSQASQAAELIGAQILESDIPAEYRNP